MTKDELRKIFDEAEKSVYNSESLAKKLAAEFSDSEKLPAENLEGFAIRVNRIVYREILIEVLAKVLADKTLPKP